MEQRSMIAMIENSQENKELHDDINKNMKLPSDYGRFDVILSMKNYEGNNEFRIKILGNYDIGVSVRLWVRKAAFREN